VKSFKQFLIEADVPKLTWKQIQAVAEWQNYGGSMATADDRKSIDSAPWPKEATTYSGTLFRIVQFKGPVYQKLIDGTSYQYKSYSSWTMSEKIARDFTGSHWFQDFYEEGNVAVLLKTTYNGKALDLVKLHNNPEFQAARKYYEAQGKGFDDGLDFKGLQKEVILPTMSVTKKMVYKVLNDKGSFVDPSKVRK
jgi:hypothetical protein